MHDDQEQYWLVLHVDLLLVDLQSVNAYDLREKKRMVFNLLGCLMLDLRRPACSQSSITQKTMLILVTK